MKDTTSRDCVGESLDDRPPDEEAAFRRAEEARVEVLEPREVFGRHESFRFNGPKRRAPASETAGHRRRYPGASQTYD